MTARRRMITGEKDEEEEGKVEEMISEKRTGWWRGENKIKRRGKKEWRRQEGKGE